MPGPAASPAETNSRRRFGELLLTLAIGTAGGALFALSGVPLAWLLGALVATTLATFTPLPLRLPDALRRTMIAVVGVMLGGAFVPERLQGLGAWLPSLAALPLYVLVVGVAIFAYIQRFGGFDRRSAFFAATPGGLGEMIALSDQMGADVRRVSLIHATRLMCIVLTIPWLAALFGAGPAAAPADASAPALTLLELAVLVVAGLLGYGIAAWLRLPAATFLGPLIGSASVHLSGWVTAPPPYFVLAAAQVVIGSGVGIRFAGVPLGVVRRSIALGAGATLLMFLITFLFAAFLVPLTGHSLILLLLAFIPGGFTEMSLIALAMEVDPAFVVTHHTVRVLLVVSIALPLFVLLERRGWFGRAEADAAGPAE